MPAPIKSRDYLADAARAAIDAAGGAPTLARHLGVSRFAPRQWRRVPADRVEAVAQLTGIPKEALRPDIYFSIPGQG